MTNFRNRKHTIQVTVNNTDVELYYEDYEGELFIHKINGIVNPEDVFRMDFMDDCYRAIELDKLDEKEYREGMRGDEERGN